MNHLYLLHLLLLPGVLMAGSFDIKNKLSASELADQMFGPVSSDKQTEIALNLGRVGIGIDSQLNCGMLDVSASIKGEFKQVEQQLKGALNQVKKLASNPARLSLGVVCYYKPTICSYIRHLSGQLQESINLQFDACKAVDDFIEGQAEKGSKEVQAKAIKKCMEGGALTSDKIRRCQGVEGRSRDLLYPFQEKYTERKQRLLKDSFKLLKKSDDYGLWVKLLGEVEIQKNGWWYKIFPKDLLTAESLSNNVFVKSKQAICELESLEKLVSKPERRVAAEQVLGMVQTAIKENLPKTLVKDLRSLPESDRQKACTALSKNIAAIAVKNTATDGKSTISGVLSNGALSDKLRDYYAERSKLTFDGLESSAKKIDNESPLSETLKNISKLAYEYRKLNKDSASLITAKRMINSKKSKKKCEDEISCKQAN